MLIDKFGKAADRKILNKKIIFFGASTRNKQVIDELGIHDKVLFFVDSNENKVNESMGDYFIKSINNLSGRVDCIVISVLIEPPYFQQVLDCVEQYNLECLFYTNKPFDIKNIISVDYSVGSDSLNIKDRMNKIIKNNLENIETISKYKFIHIFPNEKFFFPFYEMLVERTNISEHLFIVDYCIKGDIYKVLEGVERKNSENHNIIVFDSFDIEENARKCNLIYNNIKMTNIFAFAQKILLHSLAFGERMKKMINKWADIYGNKMIWICWGGDSYYDKDSLVIMILQKIGKAYADSECIDRIWNNYGIRAGVTPPKTTYAYVPHLDISHTYKKLEGYKYILLGHSSTGYGDIPFGLNLLQKWKDENIKIYCPLSYGSASLNYQNKVITQGKAIYGDKFIPILDFMELNQYYMLLDNMDIAVMPITEFVGVTTLSYLSFHNKKIYLNKKLIKYYQRYDIYAEDIELIKTQSFQEFLKTEAHISDDQNDLIYEGWLKIFNDDTDSYK